MRKLLFLILFLFSTCLLMGQATTQTALHGKIQFDSFSVGGTSDVVGDLNAWSDQTNQYFANNIQVGDVLWDNAGNRWEVVVINSSTLFNANVDLRDINSVGGVPTGVGYVSRETPNLGLSLLVPDNNIGISQQLKSRVETHNMILIDAISTATGVQDSVYQGAALSDTTTVAAPEVGDVFVDQEGNVSFYDGNNWVVYTAVAPVKTVYDAGIGFYCYCTPGVTVASGGTGIYNITVPEGADISSIQKRFTNAATEYTVGGEAVINIDWTGATWNSSFTDGVLPNVKIFDPAGTQREPGAISVTSQTTAVSGGQSATTIANINGVGVPLTVKIHL